ncbi:MAG: hypothetical protein K2J42_01905, partial [Muribaculaceae bacterium]|nr:hypothetical protein [Muribaculaceae bacterium]
MRTASSLPKVEAPSSRALKVGDVSLVPFSLALLSSERIDVSYTHIRAHEPLMNLVRPRISVK